MSMRKTAMAMALTAGLAGGVIAPVMAGGIPVIDVASLTQNIQQVTHALEQIRQLEAQLRQAEKELDSMSGVRGMAGIIASVYDNNMDDVDLNGILSDNGIKSSRHYEMSGNVADLYNARNRSAAYWKGRSTKFMIQAQQRFDQLQRLVAQVNAAPDQKDVLDLQARIQAEETMLQNELIKLNMMKSEAEAQRAIDDQKEVQIRLDMKQGSTTRFSGS